MNDDTREKRWQDHFPRLLPRYALLACLALVVVSLGVALTPPRPREPADPPFSEQARAAALTETLRLRAAGTQLGPAARDGSTASPGGSPPDGSAAGNPAIERTVTLLTTQAQALLAPGETTPEATGTSPAESVPATPSAGGPSTAGSSPAPLPATAAELVAALADSGRQRLAAAALADGGMARLLAAVGTAQLLQASALAAATGTAPPPADVAFPEPSGTCPSAAAADQSAAAATESSDDASSDASRAVPDSPDAAVGAALAAVIRTEAQTVYGYQVALPRLGGDTAKSAAEDLARHDALLSGAESLSRVHCSAVPPREAGYTLDKSFLASPAAGLGSLEAAALPAYGDLVALSQGETRQWAIAALLDSGKRAVRRGADPGPLPGLAADASSLPSLPAPSLPAG